jgi:hypothetical protein
MPAGQRPRAFLQQLATVVALTRQVEPFRSQEPRSTDKWNLRSRAPRCTAEWNLSATPDARAVDKSVNVARLWIAGWTVARVAAQCRHAEADQSRRPGAGIPGPQCGARRRAHSRRASWASGAAAVSWRVLARGSRADTRVVRLRSFRPWLANGTFRPWLCSLCGKAGPGSLVRVASPSWLPCR